VAPDGTQGRAAPGEEGEAEVAAALALLLVEEGAVVLEDQRPLRIEHVLEHQGALVARERPEQHLEDAPDDDTCAKERAGIIIINYRAWPRLRLCGYRS
jgi:hypothetical protein